jgi:methyl halide transferase
MELDETYWSKRYEDNNAAWDIGDISTPLQQYINQLTDKNIAILIPGCGNSYEAAYLLQQGFANITLIDISTTLCKIIEYKFAAYLGNGLTIICGDFFELQGQYDLIFEQTFLCALNPSLRKKYVEKMQQLLKPGRKLIGVLFNKNFENNPPFGGNETEYRELFHQFFSIEIMEPCYNSIIPRNGAELFIKLKRQL